MAMNGSFRTLTFDGEVSTDYGVYISGDGTFNAPLRDVEMITIPGRNGNFVLDNGRFENIEVPYRAGLFGVDEENFADKIAAFRNFLCSRSGYCRLEDDYNPDEYRLAVYKSGLEVEPELLKAGEFDIVFDCKPQRFLKSGEEASTFASGDTITNPTRFAASPLLEVYGYGKVNLGDESITLYNNPIGAIPVGISSQPRGSSYSGVSSISEPAIMNLSGVLYNSGDTFTFSGEAWTIVNQSNVSVSNISNAAFAFTPWWISDLEAQTSLTIRFNNISFVMGTPSTQTCTCSLTSGSTTKTFTIELAFDGTDQVTITLTIGSGWTISSIYSKSEYGGNYAGEVYDGVTGSIYSTVNNYPEPMYVDLDIGEAYYISGGEPMSGNNIVSIPSKPPTLAGGETQITTDGTISRLDITPRWWRV